MSFNPILEVRSLPRVRLNIRDLRATVTTALVLISDGAEPLVVRAGERVPNARTANYREAYVVDMTERTLTLGTALPSYDGALSFRAQVNCVCQVDDPVLIVRNSVRDAAETLRPLILRELRAVSSNFQAHQMGQAEKVIDRRLSEFRPEGIGLTIKRGSVELSLDPDVERAIRTKHNVSASLETDQLRYDQLIPMIESGDTGLLAMYLGRNPGQAGAVFDLLLTHENERGAQMIEAIKTAMAGRSPDDDFQIEDARTRMIDKAVEGLSGSAGRGGRLRGSLLRGEEVPEIGRAPEPSGSGETLDGKPYKPADPDAGA